MFKGLERVGHRVVKLSEAEEQGLVAGIQTNIDFGYVPDTRSVSIHAETVHSHATIFMTLHW